MEFLQLEIVQSFLYLFVSVLLLISSFWIKEYWTSYKIKTELLKPNIAVGISFSGYLIAVLLVLLGAFASPSKGAFFDDMIAFLLYSLLGIFLLNISRFINERLILHSFSNVDELINDQNCGTGAVEFGAYIASGLVVTGSIYGQGGGWYTTLIFFVASQTVLIGFCFLYNFITPYDIHEEIKKDNFAVGIALGGALVAVGIILFKGIAGDFISWYESIVNFVASTFISFLLMPVLRYIFDKAFIPGLELDVEIAENKNSAVGILEMVFLIIFAVMISFMIDFDFLNL